MTRKQRVARVVYVAYVAIIAAFTVSNIVQVARVVFSSGDDRGASAEAPSAPSPRVGPACAASLVAELRAIDTAHGRALTEPTTEGAGARYETERRSPIARARQAQTGDPQKMCANDPAGADAIAAVARLDRITGGHVVRSAAELSPVRRAAQSFIRDQPR